jgi:hypothetical protein
MEDCIMNIIDSLGSTSSFGKHLYLCGPKGLYKGFIGGKMTAAASITRTAGQVSTINWGTTIFDYGKVVAASGNSLIVPVSGYYACLAYISSADASTKPTMVLEIHSHSLGGPFAYQTKYQSLPTATFPNQISVSGVRYMDEGDWTYVYWGTTIACTSLTGERNMGFAMIKL